MSRKKWKRSCRTLVQALATLGTNAHLAGFLTGRISTGPLKYGCVPGLNCYSCPGAVGACPIGSLQAVIGGHKYSFSFYVLGILMLFGLALGRAVCGFLCPFGFLQDLLDRVPLPKLRVPGRADRRLRWLKYGVLAVAVILLPMVLTNAFGIAPPYFCKWICPAGTLEGGLPLLIANEGLRKSVGWLFSWKVLLLTATVLASMTIARPFCKYVCPLGALYSLMNRISLCRLELDRNRCTGCRLCERTCRMGVKILRDLNSRECIRCGECVRACPGQAITVRFGRAVLNKPACPEKSA